MLELQDEILRKIFNQQNDNHKSFSPHAEDNNTMRRLFKVHGSLWRREK